MNLRENHEGLVIFNTVVVAQQTLDMALLRTPPTCEGREYISRASKMLEDACELIEKFVEGIKAEAS
jgi:hypothetical protein